MMRGGKDTIQRGRKSGGKNHAPVKATGREVRISTAQVLDRLLGPLVAAGRLVQYDGLGLGDLLKMVEAMGEMIHQEAPPERKTVRCPGPPHPTGRPRYNRESA